MNKFFYYLFFIFIISCSPTEQIIDYSNAPDWVQEHPLSKEDYIGVGVSKKKKVTDYREQAKKNAFNEISSSISVSVSSNSVLKQQENNGKFNEMFNTSTETHTNNELSGCRQVARWENKNEYWVYYKLDKAKVEEAKRLAIEDATISLRQALKYDAQNDYPKAISNYSLALSAVKPYFGDRLKTEFNGQVIFLGQYILDHYRALINSVKLEADENSVLTFKAFKPIAPLLVRVTRNNVSLSNIPLKIKSKDFKYTGTYKFDDNGEVVLPDISANTYQGKEVVVLSVDIEKMVEESVSDDLVKEILISYETTYLELVYRIELESNDGFPSIQKGENISDIYQMPDVNIQKELDKVLNEIDLHNLPSDNQQANAPSGSNHQQLLNIAKSNVFWNEKIKKIKKFIQSANMQYYSSEIKEVIHEIDFDKQKLEVAKLCYDYVIDQSNYYRLDTEFSFPSTKKEFNSFINK